MPCGARRATTSLTSSRPSPAIPTAAGNREVDFKSDPEAVRRTINAWAARQTNDRIKNIVSPNALNPDSRLLLANAVYFKAAWAMQFSKRGTSDQPFHITAKESVKVPLMVDRSHPDYLDGGDFQVLELAYAGWGVSMVFLLPKKRDDLADFEKTLTADRLSGWLAKLKLTDVVYHIPVFRCSRR